MLSPRRRVPRRTINVSVGVLRQGEYRIERAKQLGEGGMMVSSERALTKGDRLVLTFQVPGGSLVIVTGIVRYVQEHQTPALCYGVEFSNLNFIYKREIRNFVASSTDDEDPSNIYAKEAT